MSAPLQGRLRQLFVLGACLLAPLVFAVGLAWACGPASYTSVQPTSGALGAQATVTGRGFPPGPVEVRWDTRDSPVLTTAAGPDFSANVTVPNTAPGVHYVVAVSRDVDGSIAYQSSVPFQVLPPSLSLRPTSGPGGSTTTATGSSFGSGSVEIHWDTPSGALLKTAIGPDFSTPVTIPDSGVGEHNIVALSRDSGGNQAGVRSARFQVTATPVAPAPPAGDVIATLQAPPVSPRPPPPDDTGPSVTETELTRQNGTRTVSRKGEVRVFCGLFTEGVTGVCGATGARARGEPARSVPLKLGARTFKAESGRPVLLRFVLSKPAMKTLVAAKKARVRGRVRARDANGNLTQVSFGLTLKAPPRQPLRD